MSSETRVGYIYLLAAGTLWATGGVWAKILFGLELTTRQVVLVRTTIALVALAAFMAWKKRKEFKARPQDLLLLTGVALTGVGLFSVAYFYTIEIASITQAVFLLYTAPIMTTILGRVFLKELLVASKVVALFCSMAGLLLLTRLYAPGSLDLPGVALATGLASAFLYASFNLLGKLALARYSPWTVQFYTFSIGVLFLIFFTRPGTELFQLSLTSWGVLVVMGVVATFAPFFLFYRGLERVEASRANLIATIEPVVASLLGMAFFAERLDGWQALGAGLILLGAILVQRQG